MSDEFGGSILTVTDDDGNEFELEIIDEIEYEGESFTVFLPADIDTMDADDPDFGYVILRNVEENGEEYFESVDDEALLEKVYEHYMEILELEEDEEE